MFQWRKLTTLTRIACFLTLTGCGLEPGPRTTDLGGAWNGEWVFDLEPLHYDGKCAVLFTFDEEAKEVTFFLKIAGDYFDTMGEPAEILLTGPYTDTTFNLSGDSSWTGHMELNYNDGVLSGHATPTFSPDTTIAGHASENEFRMIISFFGYDKTEFVLTQGGPAPVKTIVAEPEDESESEDTGATDAPPGDDEPATTEDTTEGLGGTDTPGQ